MESDLWEDSVLIYVRGSDFLGLDVTILDSKPDDTLDVCGAEAFLAVSSTADANFFFALGFSSSGAFLSFPKPLHCVSRSYGSRYVRAK